VTVYQGQIRVQAVSYVGTAAMSYQVDTSGNTWDIGGGIEYAASSQGGITPTISAWHLCQGAIQITSTASVTLTAIRVQLNAIAQEYAPEDYLTIAQDEDGDWFATLDDTYWSDLGQNSVYAGFRIISEDGLAYISEDPQHHVKTVPITLVTPFNVWRMYPGQWHLYIPLGTDFNAPVNSPNYFRSSDLISAYMSDVQKYVVSESQYLTNRAGDLRKWNRIPSEFLDQLLATLGCYLRLDQLDSEARRRLAFEWIRFLLYAGDRLFVDFLGYVYDTHFGVEALWTNNYRNFVSFSPDLDDSYYPTNHVALTYDPDDWDMDDFDQWSLIIDTFYQLASVPLVLEALAAKRKDNTTLYLIVADHTSHDYFSWSPLLFIASTTLYMTMVDHRRIHRESYAPPLQINFMTVYVVMVDHRHIERSSYSPLLVISSTG
jgi:hypothetical protein